MVVQNYTPILAGESQTGFLYIIPDNMVEGLLIFHRGIGHRLARGFIDAGYVHQNNFRSRVITFMENHALFETRRQIALASSLMLQRNLTDLAGGNISVRMGDQILMTPSLAGTYKYWRLEPEDVLVLDLDGNIVDGSGTISREAPTHLKLLRHLYPDGKAVIHAHPRHTMVFCVAQQPITPVFESTMMFGEIKVVDFAPGGIRSDQLAQNVFNGLVDQREKFAKRAAAVLVPWHGIFAIGKDLQSTLDAVDRIENNAYCILMSKLLRGSDFDSAENYHRALATAIRAETTPGNE